MAPTPVQRLKSCAFGRAEFTDFFTPGVTVIFLLGLFWRRATEAGAIAAAVTFVLLSWALTAAAAALPFLDRMGWVFGASLAVAVAVAVSLAAKARPGRDTIETRDVRFATSPGFNAGALAMGLVLITLYATLW